MHETEKFTYYPMRKPRRIQPECPVYLYGYGLAVQRSSGAAFVQLRLVNRWDSPVHSVFLHITGKELSGRILYELRFVPLVDCHGELHKDFGEEQVLFLPEGQVQSLDIEIEDVLFEDGMIWRRQLGHQLLTAEAAGWITCPCGMKNPREEESCCYCRRPLTTAPAEAAPGPKVIVFPGMEAPAVSPVVQEEAPVILQEPEITPVAEESPAPEVPVTRDLPEQEPPVPVEEEIHPEHVPEELAHLLACLGPWTNRSGEGEGREPETVEETAAPVQSTEQERPHEAGASGEEEAAQEEPSNDPMDMMTETAQMIRELQRRIQVREEGQTIEATADSHNTAPDHGAENKAPKEKGRSVGFWIFMILLMCILALAGFFGVLYLKGYFG